ncbi:hypothetical protein, partial [Bacillus sp. SIMBA_005]|uniref:hypothetical protein n=1 Tax=Bacillus sp. SIMBA_005 TaxID=3085754 RepID=UPI00397DF237
VFVVGQRVQMPDESQGVVAVHVERDINRTLKLDPRGGAVFTTTVITDEGEVKEFLDSALTHADEGEDYS